MTKHEQVLEEAFNHYNKQLFDGDLPRCIIRAMPATKAVKDGGYIKPFNEKDRFGEKAHGIYLDSTQFLDRSIEQVLACLAHQMVHVWEYHNYAKSKKVYKSSEHSVKLWRPKFNSIGLILLKNSNGHEVIEGGQFERATDKLISSGFKIDWGSIGEQRKAATNTGRVKYTCHLCDIKMYSKPTLESGGFCPNVKEALIDYIKRIGLPEDVVNDVKQILEDHEYLTDGQWLERNP